MLRRSRYILILASILFVCCFFIKRCNKKQAENSMPVSANLESIFRDTITTTAVTTKIDTVVVEIEQAINSIMDKTETVVKEVVDERDSVVVRLVELQKITNITVYDTVKVYVDIPPDSVTIYNVWEYEGFDGKVTRSTRDTISKRRVYRHYAQKYIMK